MPSIFRNRLCARSGNSVLERGWRQWQSRFVSSQSPIIIGGCPRSGTTLTQVILNAHPNIACGPESSLLMGRVQKVELLKNYELSAAELAQLYRSAADHANLIELFFTRYAVRQGKRRWAEKTPANVRHLAYIFRCFPNAKFVHVVRDGRDVICSLRRHPKYRLVAGQLMPTKIQRPLQVCVRRWLRDTAAGLAWRGHPNYLELRYEDLVKNTEPTLRRLCEFIEEPWDSGLTEYYRQQGQLKNLHHLSGRANVRQQISIKAVERWRDELTEAELRMFNRLAAHQMAEFGYQNQFVPGAGQPAFSKSTCGLVAL